MRATGTMRQAALLRAGAVLVAFAALAITLHGRSWIDAAVLSVAPLTALVAWIAIVDARTYTIPDAALALLAFLALALRLADPLLALAPLPGLGLIAVDGLVAGGAVLIVREVYYRRRGVDGIGFGDVKLAAVGGILCGLFGFSLALLAASIAGLAAALASRARGGRVPSKLPFGAFLAPALWLVWLTAL